jgi:peptide-methionine (S)-S-oxide reductase
MKPRRFVVRLAAGLAAAAAPAALWLAQAAHAQTPAPAAPATTPARTEIATFAGGCFWCVEADFDKVPGVISTTSGYTGGRVANPSYEQVSGKRTGHAEAVQIVFDPARVSYPQLVEKYWRTIDPTVRDRQFCDAGSPYRTAIFANSDAQLAAAKASLAALEKSKPFKDPIVTTIERAGPFYAAEEYHQDYYKKNPVRYAYYRTSCGRDARLKQLWGSAATH